MKKKKLLIYIPLGLLLAIVVVFFGYTGNYYHASEYAYSNMTSTEQVTVTVGAHQEIAFVPDNIKAGVVFYPGGLVEYDAYAPLMMKLAENDILAVVVKMPFKLAMFNSNGAKEAMSDYAYVDEWYIGGHSLGGVFAAKYASENADSFNGVFLLASYSTEDISDSNLQVLSIYGTSDGVLNMKNYEKSKSNLPSDFKEIIIDGGCHAYFGAYGEQRGDGSPSISVEVQTEETADLICNYIK